MFIKELMGSWAAILCSEFPVQIVILQIVVSLSKKHIDTVCGVEQDFIWN
jgi:hypothetical protein